MSQPMTLKSLTPREAIADALYRCLLGLDFDDHEMFESAWIGGEQCCFEMDGSKQEGMKTINEQLFAFIGPLATQHNVSNIRIEYTDGAKVALLTAYAVAQHYRSGEGLDPTTKHFTSGIRYFVDVVLDETDGIWKLKKWREQAIWFDGDKSVVGM